MRLHTDLADRLHHLTEEAAEIVRIVFGRDDWLRRQREARFEDTRAEQVGVADAPGWTPFGGRRSA